MGRSSYETHDSIDYKAVLRILERDALNSSVDFLHQPLLLFYEMGIIRFLLWQASHRAERT